MIPFSRTALPSKQCLYNSNCSLPLSLSLTVIVAIFFLNFLNVWQLRWAAAALVVFHCSNCKPPPSHSPSPSPLCCSSHHQWIYSPITVAMECSISWNNKTCSFHNGGTSGLTLQAEASVARQQAVSSARCSQSNCRSL